MKSVLDAFDLALTTVEEAMDKTTFTPGPWARIGSVTTRLENRVDERGMTAMEREMFRE